MAIQLDPFQTIKAFVSGGVPWYRKRIIFYTSSNTISFFGSCSGATVLPPARYATSKIATVQPKRADMNTPGGLTAYRNTEKFTGGAWVDLEQQGADAAVNTSGLVDVSASDYPFPLAFGGQYSALNPRALGADATFENAVTEDGITYYTKVNHRLLSMLEYTSGLQCASAAAPLPGGDNIREVALYTSGSEVVAHTIAFDQALGAIPDLEAFSSALSGDLNVVGFMPDDDLSTIFPYKNYVSVWAVGHATGTPP